MSALQPSWPTPLVESRSAAYAVLPLRFFKRIHRRPHPNGELRQCVAVAASLPGTASNSTVLPPSYIQHNSNGDRRLRRHLGADEIPHRLSQCRARQLYCDSSPEPHLRLQPRIKWRAYRFMEADACRRHRASSKHFDVGKSLSARLLPTGKIATQGRSIAWNALVQDHVTRSFWFETRK